MNRNVESHFSTLPSAEIQRSMFDRSCSHKTSFNSGELIPIFWDEVLPGDTWQVSTSKVIRAQTMLTPILDNIYADMYWFFVPNRIIYEHWEEFCGENKTGPWAPTVKYFTPKIESPDGGFQTCTIADYMGIPVGLEFKNSAGTAENPIRLPIALPFRAYAKICSDFFRDENLSDPLWIPMSDALTTGTNDDGLEAPARGGRPFKVAKYHDYFTSCLPSPQKGDSVAILNQFKMPVHAERDTIPRSLQDFGIGFNFLNTSEEPQRGGASLFYNEKKASGNLFLSGSNGSAPSLSISNSFVSCQNQLPSFNSYTMSPDNLWAVPDASISLNVNDLRLSFALQRFYEKQARQGSRYTEFLAGMFGVESPDSRLQRPEYLGGNRIPIQIHEVANTAQSEADFLGDLGALSQTSDNHDDFVKSFTEHGILIGVICVRYDHSYSQGFEKQWMRNDLFDYYMPGFANLGESPVYQYEIVATQDNMKQNGNVFGYQEHYAEYRYKPNRISGEMRPGISNTLASWHLGDYYTEAPTLSDAWIREDKTNIDRTLAVTSQLANQFFGDFYFNCTVTRPMPMYSIPGLIDHY